MGTPSPACTDCGRTHTAAGKPVILKVKGEHKGLCKTCMKRLVWSKADPGEQVHIEATARSLEYFMQARRARIARHQKPLSAPRSA